MGTFPEDFDPPERIAGSIVLFLIVVLLVVVLIPRSLFFIIAEIFQ